MRVLVACEYSATVRDAFRARGHDACDVMQPCMVKGGTDGFVHKDYKVEGACDANF